MTEIKRLSDDDIALLKGITDRCSCCCLDILNNKSGKRCFNYVGIEGDCSCRSIKDKAILLEMEARERDKMEEKKQLPTESELMAELEKKCDSVSEINGMECTVKNIKWDRCFVLEISSNHCTFSSGHYRYRPDIEPPAKNTVVIVHYEPNYRDGFFDFPVVSLGELNGNGEIKFQDGPCKHKYSKDWYDPKTGNHSAGWDMAWIDGVV